MLTHLLVSIRRISFALPLALLVVSSFGIVSSGAAPIDVPFYSQQDKDWISHSLGQAHEQQTIGDFGCGVTSAAMVVSYYTGQVVTPLALNDALKNAGGFSDANMTWNAEAFKVATGNQIKGVANLHPWDDQWKTQKPKEILRGHVQAGRPVIVYLGNAHYVVVTRYDAQSDVFYINDPWKKDQSDGFNIAFEKNAKGMSLSNITQMIILYPQVSFPPDVNWPAILEKYVKLGGEKGVLGPSARPAEDIVVSPTQKGRAQKFAYGTIYVFPGTGGSEAAYWLPTTLAQFYERHLQELGHPVRDAYSGRVQLGVSSKARADFEHGSLIAFEGEPEPQLILADKAFRAEYYNNLDLQGTPVISRYEPDILFDWGAESPGPGLNRDGFSARWTGNVEFNIPFLRWFHVFADDRVRLKVDGESVIDSWKAQPNSAHEATKFMGSGKHSIVLEYADETGDASVFWAVTEPGVRPAFAAENALGAAAIQPEKAPLLSPAAYPPLNPNKVVCNNWFVVDRAVSASEVQTLFESAGTNLAKYIDPTNGLSASQIVASAIESNQVQQRYRLNPRFLLVKMEVESNTIWGARQKHVDDVITLKDKSVGTMVDWLLFYGWPDDPSNVDLTKKGFTNQVNNSVRVLTADFGNLINNGPGRNGWRVGQPYPNQIDGLTITPSNAATAALYIYTPHVYNDKKNIHWAWYTHGGNAVCDDALAELPPQASVKTASLFVFDVSGSMNDNDSSGVAKIEAARRAATLNLNMIARENQVQGAAHQVGIVAFSDTADVKLHATSDIAQAQSVVKSLSPNGGTNLYEGLELASQELAQSPANAKRIVILLSDGVPTVSPNPQIFPTLGVLEDEVLAGPVGKLARSGTCIYAIGLGDPRASNLLAPSIDEAFLRRIVTAAKCGAYYNAQSSQDLENVYIKLRLESTGTVLQELKGRIAQGQTVDAGRVNVPSGKSELRATLNWPGSALDFILTDPGGRRVDTSYPGASLFTDARPIYYIIKNPAAGAWSVGVFGKDVPEKITNYSAIVATSDAGGGNVGFAEFFFIGLLVVTGATLTVAASRRPAVRQSRKRAPGPTVTQVGVRLADGAFVSLGDDGLTVGRAPDCGVRLDDKKVSRQHARITHETEGYVIQDLGSANGTRVNGKRVTRVRLHDGDEIRVGGVRMRFRGK